MQGLIPRSRTGDLPGCRKTPCTAFVAAGFTRHRFFQQPARPKPAGRVSLGAMKGQLKVSTPAEYIARLAEPRKSEIAALDKLIRKAAPKLQPFIHIGMLAYGPCRYKYPSGREGDWFRIGVASNKNYVSLYVCATDGKCYIAERYKKVLPKANIGKSCVRFKRLSDLDDKVLVKLIREGAAAPAAM